MAELLSALGQGHRAVLFTPEAEDGSPVLHGGMIPVMTAAHVARLALAPELSTLRAGLAPAWRNKLAQAERTGLRVTETSLPDNPGHWLLGAEAAQAQARGYARLPPAFARAWARSGRTLLLAAEGGPRAAGGYPDPDPSPLGHLPPRLDIASRAQAPCAHSAALEGDRAAEGDGDPGAGAGPARHGADGRHRAVQARNRSGSLSARGDLAPRAGHGLCGPDCAARAPRGRRAADRETVRARLTGSGPRPEGPAQACADAASRSGSRSRPAYGGREARPSEALCTMLLRSGASTTPERSSALPGTGGPSPPPGHHRVRLAPRRRTGPLHACREETVPAAGGGPSPNRHRLPAPAVRWPDPRQEKPQAADLIRCAPHPPSAHFR